jgi:murein DD-endopeptidase MepM/ murein hydrolase activator NlpD
MTANIIEDQHVARRRKSSPLHKGNYQSAVFGADFMHRITQRPAHVKRRKASVKSAAWGQTVKYRNRSEYAGARNNVRKDTPNSKRKSGFSFPVPSLMTLAVIAGTLVISLIALNWDGLTLPQTIPFEPGPDSAGMRNLAAYAGLPDLGVGDDSAAISTNTAPATAPLTATQSAPVITESAPVPIIQTVPAAAAVPATIAPVVTAETAETGAGIPLDLMESFKWATYKVQKGDSVSKIAARFGISMDAIITSNNIRNARRLGEGETLRIPNMDGIPHTVVKGDSLSKIAKTYAVPLEVILDVNDVRSDAIREGEILFIPGARMAPEALRLALGEMFIYPVRKRITSNFGWRNSPITGERHFHAALDLAGATGTTVKAAMDATVSVVSVDRAFGKYIILSHANGYQTLYAHLSVSSVKEGERVTQGGKIGEVGSTGLSTGPHLHFGVFKNGKPVNPLDLLN